ncbi:unnamed protein product [Rotaria magnacalcarata]|uniref:AB hydrolase-1 domain-containing protein n=3 Tax=Rotaria magnacalcarata TaxID=392030 RepID=A0A816U7J3_9BILA|nr:unnamed protein product [Rotaria magnacalcarata]CAF4017010.1 unnamed protein product [Rotaria magnacalcarata]
MSSDFIEIAVTPTSFLAYSIVGIACLSAIYSILGTLLTFFQYIRVGQKRFFERIDRPTPPTKALDPIYGTHEMIKLKSSGVSLHYVSKGVPNQPMILFIHGFPECWYTWRYQMKYFAKDYRVVAIDQRGYGVSSKLPFVFDYRVEALAGDVADVIEQLGYESCILVGHDSGGFVAWTTAMLYPHLVEKLIVMNSPHPVAFRHDFSLSQVHRSWYMFFSQTPLVPETLFQADDFSVFKKAYHGKGSRLVNRNNVTDEDIDVYKYTFSQPGTTKAAVNYFRALFRYQSDFSRAEVTAPVLLLWGCQDPTLCEELADASLKYCSDLRVQKISTSSRWINQDVPDAVNKYMEVFLNENTPSEHTYDF